MKPSRDRKGAELLFREPEVPLEKNFLSLAVTAQQILGKHTCYTLGPGISTPAPKV